MSEIKHRRVKIENVDGPPWDGLQKYISTYYAHLSRNPELKTSLDKQIKAAETFYNQYVKWLSQYPEHDTEENRELYREQIDYLTQIYTKQAKAKATSERKSTVFNKVMEGTK